MNGKQKALLFIVGITIIIFLLILLALSGGDLSDIQIHKGFHINLN